MKGKFLAKGIECLQIYNNLEYLDLSSNHFSVQSTKAICTLLGPGSALKTLNISGCLKTFEQARSIILAMFENQTVRILNLSHSKMNHSGNEFGSILGRLMVLNKDLIHLDVSSCGLTGPDLVYMTLCLLENNHIMALHLGYNNCDENCKNVIKALLGANE